MDERKISQPNCIRNCETLLGVLYNIKIVNYVSMATYWVPDVLNFKGSSGMHWTLFSHLFDLKSV